MEPGTGPLYSSVLFNWPLFTFQISFPVPAHHVRGSDTSRKSLACTTSICAVRAARARHSWRPAGEPVGHNCTLNECWPACGYSGLSFWAPWLCTAGMFLLVPLCLTPGQAVK